MNPAPSARLAIFKSPAIYLSLFLLSAATLAFEINLTRIFSVAQFYHFAFMIVSVALLGYGASGTALAIFPGFQHYKPAQSLASFSLGTGFSMLVSYLLINWLPFDSYSLLVDQRQVFILILHYIARIWCQWHRTGYLPRIPAWYTCPKLGMAFAGHRPQYADFLPADQLAPI
jgi:hypothetical protein